MLINNNNEQEIEFLRQPQINVKKCVISRRLVVIGYKIQIVINFG